MILNMQEGKWWLKSHSIWIKGGDKNTNFFHRYASQRKRDNTIWELKNAQGRAICSKKDLQEEVVH